MLCAGKCLYVPGVFFRVGIVGAALLHLHDEYRVIASINDQIQPAFMIHVATRDADFSLHLDFCVLRQVFRRLQAEQRENANGRLRLPNDPFQPIRVSLLPLGIEPAM